MTVTEPRPRQGSTAPGQQRTVAEAVRARAGWHIAMLQRGYLNDDPDAVGTLARIRRGAGKQINTVPDLWGLTGTGALHEEVHAGPALTRAENAVHAAVTLWALHQQSRRDAAMHIAGGPQLGQAVRDLMPPGELDQPIRQRLVRAGTATSFDVLAQRLREIVLLLRQRAIPMDYGILAEQLYRWQLPAGRTAVHREWGRDFHASRPPTAQPDATQEERP